jgi:hypothetical protein
MNIDELKQLLKEVEPKLSDSVFVNLHTFERNEKKLTLAITERLMRKCKKGKVWKSPQMLTPLKNAGYGFEEQKAMSPGGSDGIFLLTRNYKPKNQMMMKLFDRFIDKPGSGAEDIAKALGTNLGDLLPVRLVSHHMRLLGLLKKNNQTDVLVLVDYDDSK